MGSQSHVKRKERRIREEGERRHRVVVAVILAGLVCVMAAWGIGFAVMHSKTTVEEVVKSFDATLVANRVQDLPNIVTTGGSAYPVYNVIHADAKIVDHVYVVTVKRDRPAVWYVRPFFPPRTMSLAVYMNQFDSIQKVWALSPSVGEPPSGDFNRFLDRWPGRAYYELIDPANAYQYPEGGAYAVSVREALRELAGSVYAGRYGLDAYEKLLIGVGSAGLQVGNLLPAFETRAIDGSAVSQVSLLGTKSVLLSASPYCGSCYDATVALMKSAYDVGKGKWLLVIIAKADKGDARLESLMKDLPPGTVVITDPEETLSRQLYMYVSPYVVMLDSKGAVQYRGSGYKLDDAARAASNLAALP